MLGLYSKTDDFIAEKSLNKIYFTQLFLNIYPGLQEIERSLNSAIHHYKSISWLPSEDLDKQKQEAIKNIENIQTYVSKITSNFSDFLDIF